MAAAVEQLCCSYFITAMGNIRKGQSARAPEVDWGPHIGKEIW